MRTKRYRNKIVDVSPTFSKAEAIQIVKAIDENYKKPKNQSVPNSKLDLVFLSGLLTFTLRKSFVVIEEKRDMIYVSLCKEPAK